MNTPPELRLELLDHSSATIITTPLGVAPSDVLGVEAIAHPFFRTWAFAAATGLTGPRIC